MLIVGLFSIGVGDAFTVLTVIGAGLAIAMRETLLSIVGWLQIILRTPFKQGDRIEINRLQGDVVDIRLFYTTPTPSSSAERPTWKHLKNRPLRTRRGLAHRPLFELAPSPQGATLYDPKKHRRRSVRLKSYDYRRAGAATGCARTAQRQFQRGRLAPRPAASYYALMMQTTHTKRWRWWWPSPKAVGLLRAGAAPA